MPDLYNVYDYTYFLLLNDAFPWSEAPRYLIRDRDAVYGQVVTRRLNSMGIRDQPTAPRSP